MLNIFEFDMEKIKSFLAILGATLAVFVSILGIFRVLKDMFFQKRKDLREEKNSEWEMTKFMISHQDNLIKEKISACSDICVDLQKLEFLLFSSSFMSVKEKQINLNLPLEPIFIDWEIRIKEIWEIYFKVQKSVLFLNIPPPKFLYEKIKNFEDFYCNCYDDYNVEFYKQRISEFKNEGVQYLNFYVYSVVELSKFFVNKRGVLDFSLKDGPVNINIDSIVNEKFSFYLKITKRVNFNYIKPF